MLSRLKSDEVLRRVKQAVRAGDDETALELLSEEAAIESQQHRPRLVVHDISSARLVDLLGKHPEGLFMLADELPRFLSRLTAKSGASERALFLQLSNGLTPFMYDRHGREDIRIPAATLSLAGTIQPAKLARFTQDSAGQGDDGLLPRFQLAVWPDAGSTGGADNLAPDLGASSKMRLAFEAGYALRRQRSKLILRFSEDAQRIYDAWAPDFRSHANRYRGGMRSYLVKLERTICVLALLFELLEEKGSAVSAISLRRALLWAPFLECHAAKILDAGGISMSAAAAILAKRELLPSNFTPRDIYRNQWSGLDKDSTEAGLRRLERLGRVMPTARRTGGRPTLEYAWKD